MKVHSWKTYLFYREHYLQFKRTIMIELKTRYKKFLKEAGGTMGKY